MPRIGISHPITETSKLYFNYGHMYQKMDPDYYFQMRRRNDYRLSWIGNPELAFEKTISYELGFDQALGKQYLIHVAAYYKDKNNAIWNEDATIVGSVIDYKNSVPVYSFFDEKVNMLLPVDLIN